MYRFTDVVTIILCSALRAVHCVLCAPPTSDKFCCVGYAHHPNIVQHGLLILWVRHVKLSRG